MVVVPLDVLSRSTSSSLYKQMVDKNYILRCLLPEVLKEELLKMAPSSQDKTDGSQYIRLDLYKGDTPVLANITVRRLHEMDRRSFKVRLPTLKISVSIPECISLSVCLHVQCENMYVCMHGMVWYGMVWYGM